MVDAAISAKNKTAIATRMGPLLEYWPMGSAPASIHLQQHRAQGHRSSSQSMSDRPALSAPQPAPWHCHHYAMRPDLRDSADLSECNTSLNIKTVSDVTASSMSDGAILPGVSSACRSGTYPPNIEK